MPARALRRIGLIVAAGLVILGLILALRAGLTNDKEEEMFGTWGSEAKHQPRLTLNDDMTVAGHDGCNGFSGSFTLSEDGRTATFGRLLGTLMACPGVDTWLSAAGSATLEDDTLIVFNRAGAEIGRLERVEP